MSKPAFEDTLPVESGKPAFEDTLPVEQPQASNTGIESIAQPIRDVGNAVAPYTNQAMSSPDIQPFNGLNPFTKPQGGPVQQVLGSMRQVASLPLRYSASLGQASQPVSDFIAENNQPGSNLNAGLSVALGGPYFGMKDSYQNAVANPYVSSGLGMAAGAAVDPRTWIPASGVSMEHSDELPLKVAQQREARTGVPARQFQALHKDPGAFLQGHEIEQAGKNIGDAKQLAGINPGVTNDIGSLTPENIDRINPTKAVKIEDINTVLGKISKGVTASPQEAQDALDSVNSILSQPSVQNNRDVFRQWSAIKTHINDALGEAAPDVRAANQAYARQKLGQTFAAPSAVNKSGTPSKLAMLAQQVPGAVGGTIGALFGPGAAAAGYEGGKIASSLYHSPFVAGLQTAVGSAANKAINPLLSALEKMGTSPQAQALVARYLQQQKGNQ